jgi:oligopeptide/dipeptide ABC transporter ATP-binding protein
VRFQIRQNQWTGLVGETGCGKSVTAFSIIKLLPPSANIVNGNIFFKGKDLLQDSEKSLRRIRGAEISMVFQDPSVAINPALKMGTQLIETLKIHQNLSTKAAGEKAIEVFDQVGMKSYCLDQYAHELSGGMLQRVMIGLALACNPDLILADEPTSSLDVTIQKDILELMKKLGSIYKTAVLLITHDLVLVGQTCHEIVVMYAGVIVERGPTRSVLHESVHPYTQALIKAIPTIDERREMLVEIDGIVPNLLFRPQGCLFEARCPYSIQGVCEIENPKETQVGAQHYARCHLLERE